MIQVSYAVLRRSNVYTPGPSCSKRPLLKKLVSGQNVKCSS